MFMIFEWVETFLSLNETKVYGIGRSQDFRRRQYSGYIE